jgi:muramoyltetrapeptide carboxypeptidase LdcA involved in peptidoglycan recycling
MENQNFIPAETIDPKDAEIQNLREQLASADRAAAMKSEQLDDFAKAIMGVIGDRVEAIAESAAQDAASNAAREEIENLSISDFEYEIGEMIDDRMPEREDEDEQREAVESIVKEVLSGATVTIDI